MYRGEPISALRTGDALAGREGAAAPEGGGWGRSERPRARGRGGVVELGHGAVGLGDLRDAEVEDLHAGRPVHPLREKQVRGLQVPVDDAEGVGLGDGLARLEDVVDRHRRLEGGARVEHRAEILALQGTPWR